MSYRNVPKYKNTDVSASTVQNLLQTINSMSQRCRGQANTEDVLQRVRSIILMHRPHLANRIDLQLPELTMEALMPNSTNASQITHNFNYKYDYNTNVPNAYNPFVPSPQLPQSQPQQQPQQQPPLQSFTFNAIPPTVTTTTTTVPTTQSETSSATPQTVVVTAPLSIEQSDLSNLNVLYVNAQRTPSVASYKQLLRHIVYLVQKYVRYEQITIGLELLENFDTIQTYNNDIAELLQCIERETNWILPNGPSVCRWISALIMSYCRIVGRVTKREFVMSSVRTEDRLMTVIADVENAVVNMVNAPSAVQPSTITPEIETINNQQIQLLNNTIQQQQFEMTKMQTRYTSLEQQYDAFQSKTLVLNTAFDKLRNYYRTNVTSPAPESEQELVTRLIRYVDEIQSAQTSVSQQSQAQSAALTQQTQAYQQLQQQLVQMETRYDETVAELRRRIDEKDTYLAETTLKLSSFEDVQSQLRAVQARNDELQAQIATLDDSYRRLQERNKSLEDSYSRLQDENKKRRSSVAVKPIRKVKAVRRIDEQKAKLIEETQRLIQQHKLKNQQLQEMKTKYNETIDSNVKMLEVIKNDALKTRSQVESLISNQAALSALDFKALNKKSTQNLADEVSLLRAENVAVREMCDRQLDIQSAQLQERFEDSKVNLVSKIDKLIEQVAPLQDRIERSATEIEDFKTRIELMGRKEAIKSTK
nr:desmoplakin [Spodoptera exigua multiple nucleopolyhedrovirus]